MKLCLQYVIYSDITIDQIPYTVVIHTVHRSPVILVTPSTLPWQSPDYRGDSLNLSLPSTPSLPLHCPPPYYIGNQPAAASFCGIVCTTIAIAIDQYDHSLLRFICITVPSVLFDNITLRWLSLPLTYLLTQFSQLGCRVTQDFLHHKHSLPRYSTLKPPLMSQYLVIQGTLYLVKETWPKCLHSMDLFFFLK